VIERIAWILRDYAGFLPGILATLVVGLATARPIGRRLGSSPALGWALVVSVGIILSATITPSYDALRHGAVGSGACDLSGLAPPAWGDLRRLSDALLNVLLFVPLGFAIGLLPPSPARSRLVILAYALPLGVETLQLIVVQLGRECESADVLNNLVGLTAGLAAGLAVRRARNARPRTDPTA